MRDSDEAACVSMNKSDELNCSQCLRNIGIRESVRHFIYAEYELQEKNTTFKIVSRKNKKRESVCEGFLS